MRPAAEEKNITKTTTMLFLASLIMFGFGYLMIPLYDVFCEITGINGKTGVVTTAAAKTAVVAADRLVTVEFDTNVRSDLHWDFKASAFKMQVHPGQIAEMIFIAENKSDRPVTGQAVPSVAPQKASLFFNKTECFCFTQQTLMPGERREMPVRFIVDAALPEQINTMTLSYTFFVAPDQKK